MVHCECEGERRVGNRVDVFDHAVLTFSPIHPNVALHASPLVLTSLLPADLSGRLQS